MKTNSFLFVLLAGLALSFGSCSVSQHSAAYGWDYQDARDGGFESIEPRSEADGSLYDPEDKGAPENFQRKVIYSASVDLAMTNTDTLTHRFQRICSKYGGYINSINSKVAVIRVRSEYLHQALADMGGMGKLSNIDLKGQDVTDQYYDLQVRLDNAQKARKRYQELLAKAHDVKSALMVERELERLNSVIDKLQGQLQQKDHLLAYSTITAYINGRVKPGLLSYVGIGVYKSVKWLFVRN